MNIKSDTTHIQRTVQHIPINMNLSLKYPFFRNILQKKKERRKKQCRLLLVQFTCYKIIANYYTNYRTYVKYRMEGNEANLSSEYLFSMNKLFI